MAFGDDTPKGDEFFLKTDALIQKDNLVFKWFDQNSDGYLTKDDMDKMISMFTGLADETDEKNRTDMREGFTNWWNFALEGREDKSIEKITPQEFNRAMRDVVTIPGNYELSIVKALDAMRRALDKDGNGIVSLEEWLELYKALTIPLDFGRESFKKLDRNSDGGVNLEEFGLALNEYYLSPDPSLPGNWLLGPPNML